MVGELIGGRYELEQLVGTGGMSSVYRAHDTLLERRVALKILHDAYAEDDEYVERFRREARAVAQLAHPNIVTVIDRGEDDGRQFIVFEYVEGENLKELLMRTGPLPISRVVELALEMARALSFAHQLGLVHRDVKPQNVLLNGDGRAKMTDFGIARSLDVDRGVTDSGTILGTSFYIAPEQAKGERIDAQTDIYSLGCVLFELLTARVPFEGESFVAVAMRHVNDPAPDVRELRTDVPPRLAALVARALEKDPAARFRTMQEVIVELEAVQDELEDATDPERTMIVSQPLVVSTSRRRRSRLPILLVVLAALLAAAAAAAVLAGR